MGEMQIMKVHAKLPDDDAGAKLMRFENGRGQRYTEIFLIGGNAITKHLVCPHRGRDGQHRPRGRDRARVARGRGVRSRIWMAR